ncbi:hypothetical protein E2C01_002171 [Portunus trituberculatus]|uniref:Uncharacterized protein n=1 Tax=Portunus trituberculatus TaxID=210409 RepID=A0A5B7CMF1_PORTR|nr:hypothetical protein [Portunus trituberculatus]
MAQWNLRSSTSHQFYQLCPNMYSTLQHCHRIIAGIIGRTAANCDLLRIPYMDSMNSTNVCSFQTLESK